MRGYKNFNFPMFDEAAKNLRSIGWEVFSPAEHDRDSGFDETLNDLTGFDLREAFAWDCARICESDYIVLLPGWEKSTGAAAELAVAKMVGTEVRYYKPGPAWSISLDDPFATFKHTGAQQADYNRVYTPPIETLLPFNGTNEVRSINATTGAEKGVKLARYDLIPALPLDILAEHYGRGARKYADRNWEKGYEWSKSFAALQRHAWLFWQGEDIDPETGSPHMAAVAWHAFALLEWANTHPELDDRPL